MRDAWSRLTEPSPGLTGWVRTSYAHKVRDRAIRYADHTWPVAPLAVPRHGRCPCERGTCVEPHLLGDTPVSSAAQAAATWEERQWDIALVTTHFDVVELPAQYGAPLHQLLKTSCPTAMAPAHRRWLFFLVRGSVESGLISSAGGVLYSGPHGWVPAPGTLTEATGRIRWLAHPYLTNWQPYQRRDPIDAVFATVDWSAADAPEPELPRIVSEALK